MLQTAQNGVAMPEKRKQMEYRDVEKYILDIPKFTKKNQFDVTSKFYEFLGRPGEKQKIIHVAGTNGKGSVCAYLAEILKQHGFRCGMFTSPHLITMRERIKLDHTDIAEAEFTLLFSKLQKACQEFRDGREEYKDYHPTFFEYLFFMAMLWYEEKRPDYILLETGLGGRLDTTNVVKKKELCIITHIAFDHMEYLGETLREIASEKAGIIAANTPIVYLESGREADEVIVNRARSVGAYDICIPYSTLEAIKSHENFIDFSFPFQYYGNILVRANTYGVYQALNIALALRSAEILLGNRLQLDKTLYAAKSVSWPCRMEEVLPGVIVDGAHNPDGVELFLQSVKQIKGRKTLLFSVVRDKNREAMIESIMKANLFEHITVTAVGGSRAGNVEEMKAMFLRYRKENTENPSGQKERADKALIESKKAETPCAPAQKKQTEETCENQKEKTGKREDYITAIDDVIKAFHHSRKIQGDGKLFVCGSLYLAGAVKELCEK